MTDKHNRPANFGAGPSPLPLPILLEAQEKLLDFAGTGMSVMEISHRSKTFVSLMEHVKETIRELLEIPETHEILLVQGGGTAQFSAVALNLLAARAPRTRAYYAVTGSWSQKAAEEAQVLGVEVVELMNGKKALGGYTGIPPASTWTVPKAEDVEDTSYIYYCGNETVHGVEFVLPEEASPRGIPIIADLSSNILTHAIDWTRHAVVYAGAQKNIGIAGVTIIVARKDLLGPRAQHIPIMLDWKVAADAGSLYNTPATFSIYMLSLFLDWVKREGGEEEMERRAKLKSSIIYRTVDASQGFYYCPVAVEARSRMNLVFRIREEALEPLFLEEATAAGLLQLKGHRSTGGIRVSVYNAVEVKAVERLAEFMVEFYKAHMTTA